MVQKARIDNRNSQCGRNAFDIISNSSLAHIAKYLTTIDLFSIFIHICKRAFKIGMKSSTIQHWLLPQEWIGNECCDIDAIDTQFDLDPLLTHVKILEYCRRSYGIDLNTLIRNDRKMITCIETLKYYFPFLKRFESDDYDYDDDRNNNNKSTINNNNESFSRGMEFVIDVVANGIRLKKLCLVDLVSRIDTGINDDGLESEADVCIKNEKRLMQLLQIILPLARKDKEKEEEILQMKSKLLKNMEQTDANVEWGNIFMTPNLDQKSVDEIYVGGGVNMNHNIDNNNSLEMLEFHGFGAISSLDFSNDIPLNDNEQKFIENCIMKDNRVGKSLRNLKAFALRRRDEMAHDTETVDFVIIAVSISILNEIGSQLTSLHISDEQFWYDGYNCRYLHNNTNQKLQFYKIFDPFGNNYSNYGSIYKKHKNSKWYFINVEELCFTIYGNACTREHFFTYLSKLVNQYTFPQLKHLKVVYEDWNRNKSHTIHKIEAYSSNNDSKEDGDFLSCMIANGLESLHIIVHDIKFSVLELLKQGKHNPFYFCLNNISNTLHVFNSTYADNKKNSKKSFIIKLHLWTGIFPHIPHLNRITLNDIQQQIDIGHSGTDDCQLIEKFFQETMEQMEKLFNQMQNIFDDAMLDVVLHCDCNCMYKKEVCHIFQDIENKLKEKNETINGNINVEKNDKVNCELRVIIKTKNKSQITWGEPRFKYQCAFCNCEFLQ